jgi:hypothetical protein
MVALLCIDALVFRVLFYDYEVGIILLKYLDILVIDKILLSV